MWFVLFLLLPYTCSGWAVHHTDQWLLVIEMTDNNCRPVPGVVLRITRNDSICHEYLTTDSVYIFCWNAQGNFLIPGRTDRLEVTCIHRAKNHSTKSCVKNACVGSTAICRNRVFIPTALFYKVQQHPLPVVWRSCSTG